MFIQTEYLRFLIITNLIMFVETVLIFPYLIFYHGDITDCIKCIYIYKKIKTVLYMPNFF